MKKVDVLYVHPTRSLDNTFYSFMPMGIFALINMLISNGYTAYGINYGIEKSIDKDYSLVNDIKNIDYKVIMIDLHWYEHAYGAIEIANISKEINPKAHVIMGGLTSTIFSKEILENFNNVDYLLKGDSEKPLLDLMRLLINNKGNLNDIENITYRENGLIIDKELTYCNYNLDDLDYVSDDFLKNKEKYYITNTIGVDENRDKCGWVSIGRGCKHNCIYCDAAKDNMITLWGKEKMTYKSAKKVASDIIEYYKKGIEVVRISHDLEMFGREYYKEIFKIIRDENIKIGFNYDCFQLPSKAFIDELISTFKEDKIIIDITLLSGNENIRFKMGKLFTNKRLKEILDYLAKFEVTTRVYYSVNVIEETKEVFEETLSQIRELIDTYKSDKFYLCYQKVVLDPIALMKGMKDSDLYVTLNTFLDYYDYCKNDYKNYIGYIDNSSSLYDYKISEYNKIKSQFKKEGYNNIY